MTHAGAVLLDRDGTLNCHPGTGNYVTDASQLVVTGRACAAVRRINVAGAPVVLVTNQRWVAEETGGDRLYRAVHRALVDRLAAGGAHLDGHYYCPHPLDTCWCRKPAPGMLLLAASDLGLDLAGSVMVGDSLIDVEAGRAAGTATVLVDPSPDEANGRADVTVGDLEAAVDVALDLVSGLR